MFDFDDKQIRKFEDDLDKLSANGLPFAVADTLSGTAREAMKLGKKGVRKKFINRNTNRWTLNSIIFDKKDAFSNRSINKKSASTGSLQQYMHDQEFGVTKTSKGKHGVPVPTSFASGEGLKKNPRRKVPIQEYRRKNIRLGKNRFSSLPRARKNAALVKDAAAKNDKFIYMETQRRKWIFIVEGSAANTKVRMIWDLTKRSRSIPATPWLLPASRDALKIQPRIYKRALIKQLRKHSRYR